MGARTLHFRRFVSCDECASHNPAVTRTPPTAPANASWANPMSGDIRHTCCLCGRKEIDKGVYFWRPDVAAMPGGCAHHAHVTRVVLTDQMADPLEGVGQSAS